MPMSSRPSWRLLSIGCCLLAIYAGCSSEPRLNCYPVRGKVEVDGRPVADAAIVFHPLQAPTEPFPKPVGHTHVDGTFVLTTYVAGDGAPVGEYAITVSLREEREIGEELVRDGKNLLPYRYANPKSSGLTGNVVDGDNELPTLHLEGR